MSNATAKPQELLEELLLRKRAKDSLVDYSLISILVLFRRGITG